LKFWKRDSRPFSWHYFLQKLRTQLCNPLINCTWWTLNLNLNEKVKYLVPLLQIMMKNNCCKGVYVCSKEEFFHYISLLHLARATKAQPTILVVPPWMWTKFPKTQFLFPYKIIFSKNIWTNDKSM
jgi:hypothetical protein